MHFEALDKFIFLHSTREINIASQQYNKIIMITNCYLNIQLHKSKRIRSGPLYLFIFILTSDRNFIFVVTTSRQKKIIA